MVAKVFFGRSVALFTESIRSIMVSQFDWVGHQNIKHV